MIDPFDDTTGQFKVLINDRQQHSLWPSFAKVPRGWEVVLDDTDRDSALKYVSGYSSDIAGGKRVD
jgi:uncharacterized protein YbdZ (MbtH family)